MQKRRTDRLRRLSPDPCRGISRAARGPRDTRRWYCARARPRATARRRTRRAARRLRRQHERVPGGLVHEEPTLHLQEIAPGRVAEAADAVGGDDAMARNHDRQPVVAARLADFARVGAELARELAVRARLAARDGAHRVPDLALQRRAFDQHRNVKAGIGIVAVALELIRRARRQGIRRRLPCGRRRQEPNLDDPLVARRHGDLHPRECDHYVVHSFSICASRSSGISMPFLADASAAKRRAPGSRTSGSASMVFTTVSTRSANLSVPASAPGSMAMKACPMRGLLPSSEKNESASGPMAAPVSAAQMSSNINASIAPFAPPIGKRLPRSIASLGSVVGLPSAPSAQPSGMRSPRFMAIMILPRTTVVIARSITIGCLPLRGNAAATGLVPNSAFLPPQGGIAAGELVKAKPTRPAAATGSR